MLKIKDNVDLKELEKFGFRIKYSEFDGKPTTYVHNDFEYVYVFIKDRELTATSNTYEEEKPINDLLYDLIKADLVEKVEE